MRSIERPVDWKRASRFVVVGLLIAAVSFVVGQRDYVLFHVVAEGFAILVAVMIYVIGTRTHKYSHDGFLLFLGTAYLFVAILDFLHTMAYPGMNVFSGYTGNVTTQLWIAGRYLDALSLLAAPFFLRHRFRQGSFFWLYVIVVAALIGSIMVLPVFPTAFIQGQGLTPFKVGSEYFIMLLLVGAILHLRRRRQRLDPSTYLLTTAAMATTLLTEMSLTLYSDSGGVMNITGHLFKLLAYYLLYLGIVRRGLERPYKAIQQLNEELELRFSQRTSQLEAAKAHLEEEVAERARGEESVRHRSAIIDGINRIFHEAMVCEAEEALGRTCLAVAEEVTQSKFGFVAELNAQGRMDDIAISDPGWEACNISTPNGHGKLPMSFEVHGLYGRVLTGGKGFYTNEPSSHPDSVGTPEGHPALTAFLGVPLTHGGQTIGVVAVGNRAGGYRDEDLAALEAVAPAIVEAFMRMRAEVGRELLVAQLQDNYDELQRQSGELRAANEGLAQATALAEEAVRTRDEFLSVAAHELRTPVTSLQGFTEILIRQYERRDTVEPERIGRALEVVYQQSKKLAGLVAQLFDISRLESGRLTLERQPVELVRLVEEVAAAAQLRTTMHTISVEAPSKVEGLVDPMRIEQVVTNMVDNAIRYSPDGGPVEITVRDDGDHAEIAVRDHGIGIPPERRQRLFERFYRAHEDSRIPGLGLGLYISNQIAVLHGGRIEFDCPPDGGTSFTVRLPVLATAQN